MNGSSRGNGGFDRLRINHQPAGDIDHDLQTSIDCQKCFGDAQPLVGRIIQRPLEPLLGGSLQRGTSTG